MREERLMDLEHAEREEISPERPAEPAVTWSWETWDERRLPVEPGRVAPEGDASRRLQDLRAFYLYGRRPADAAAEPDEGVLPALLHRYRDLTRVRHEYPLCVNGSDPGIRTLTEWTDQFVAEHAPAGDDGEQMKRNFFRLEALVRSFVQESSGERLSTLWERAGASILETAQLRPEREAMVREHIAAVRKTGAGEAEVVPCGPHTALRILQLCASSFWRERCASWVGELENLVRGLQDILQADFSHSEAARSPRHLRESLGTGGEELDVDAMSHLVANTQRNSGLSPQRRAGIESLLKTLTRVQPVFDSHRAERPGDMPRHDAVFEDCAAALKAGRERMVLMTGFFRAVRIARLEIQNRYRPELHDAFFDGFDEHYLTDDERALCPPILLHLTGETFSHAETGVLLGMLNAGAPIKVLVELRSLYRPEGDAARPAVRLDGAGRLAVMAVALNHPYVMQAPISHVHTLREGLLEGLRHDGPALFCVYAPQSDAGASGAPYLRAAAAAESRFFPALVFHPGRGETLAERIDVRQNPQPGTPWPVASLAYRDADGTETSMEIAFTPADYLFCDRRFAGHFWALEPARWHDSLIPVHEFLELGARAAGRIPYLLTVDHDGRIGRTVVARAVIEAAFACRSLWHGLQETGGINSSFVKRALEAERERMAEEKEREVDAIEKNYLAQLDQDVSELTREIVQRIANQLMGAEGISFLPSPAATPARPAPGGASAASSPAAEAAVPAAAAEPEEAMSFDDPYIDTPLCTSCNECTQLNNRLFAYNANKQAEIKDAAGGPFSDLVRAAELCPVHIIHPGKPKDPAEPGLADWVARAAKFN
jgi:ferredoxin